MGEASCTCPGMAQSRLAAFGERALRHRVASRKSPLFLRAGVHAAADG